MFGVSVQEKEAIASAALTPGSTWSSNFLSYWGQCQSVFSPEKVFPLSLLSLAFCSFSSTDVLTAPWQSPHISERNCGWCYQIDFAVESRFVSLCCPIVVLPLFPGDAQDWSCCWQSPVLPHPLRAPPPRWLPSLTSLTLAVVGPGRFLCVSFGGFAVCSRLPFPSWKFAGPGANDPSGAAGVMARGVIPCPSELLVHTGSILRELIDGLVPTKVALVWKLHFLLQVLFDAHQRGARVIKQPIKTIKGEEWKRRP